MKKINLPTKITISRIVLAILLLLGIFVLYYLDYFHVITISQYDLSISKVTVNLVNLIILIVFLVASLTDFLDGYLARKNNQVTTLGKFLDPLADKILVLAAMMMLVEMQKLPAWIPIIVLAREFVVSGYRLIAVEQGGEVIAASKWGKLKTLTQMIAIILAFVDLNAFGDCFTGVLQGGDLVLNLIVTIMMIIQVIATIFSGVDYLKGAKKYMQTK